MKIRSLYVCAIALSFSVQPIAIADAADAPSMPPAPEITSSEAFIMNSWAREFRYAATVSGAFKRLLERYQAAGVKIRGTHSKGLCAAGEIQLDSTIQGLSAERQALLENSELFRSQGMTYPVHARQSNAASKIAPDFAPDVRSLALSINIDGRRQDFTFNNAPRFQIPNIRSFAALMVFQGILQSLPADMPAEEKNRIAATKTIEHFVGEGPGILADLERIKAMAAEDSGYAASYSSQSYYSGTPFYAPATLIQSPSEVQVEQFVKVGAYPCALGELANTKDLKSGTLTKEEAEAKDANYLAADFQADLAKQNGVCYRVYLQFLTDLEEYTGRPNQAQNIIEDASYTWEGKIYPFATVRLNETVDQATCDSAEKAISPIVWSQWLRGAGSINRGRYFAETMSADMRTEE